MQHAQLRAEADSAPLFRARHFGPMCHMPSPRRAPAPGPSQCAAARPNPCAIRIAFYASELVRSCNMRSYAPKSARRLCSARGTGMSAACVTFHARGEPRPRGHPSVPRHGQAHAYMPYVLHSMRVNSLGHAIGAVTRRSRLGAFVPRAGISAPCAISHARAEPRPRRHARPHTHGMAYPSPRSHLPVPGRGCARRTGPGGRRAEGAVALRVTQHRNGLGQCRPICAGLRLHLS